MPKCLECGFVAPRLQWTHFKYKCTGRFRNGQEYKEAYPDAKLVDSDLAKKTAITKSNLIKKYGQTEGTARWNTYRQKQADSNSYKYKKEKYGWSRDKFNDYNKSRAVTLKNLIKKYGEEKGSNKWMSYCEQQAYTNTLQYFIEKYGEKIGTSKYNKVCFLKSHSIESIMIRHNCTKEDAINIQNNYATQGYTSLLEKEIIRKIEEKLEHSLQYTCNTKQYCIWDGTTPKFYDIVHNNKAIEIHGDYWHMNPKKYPRNYYHKQTQLLAEDIWARDAAKKELIEKTRNIPLLTIWEYEYLNNPSNTIARCIKWLN